MVIGRLKLHPAEDRDGVEEIERRVRELNELLDGYFMADVAPALERARQARELPGA